MTWTKTTLNMKDAGGTGQPIVCYTDGTNFSFAPSLSDSGGAIIDPAVKTGSVDLLPNALANSASAYSTGMCVGGLLTIAGATRVNGGSGIIQSAVITTNATTTAFYDVVFFKTVPTSNTITDNVLFGLNQLTDLPFICGTAHCNDITQLGTPTMFQASNLGFPFKLSAANTNLYAAIIMRGAVAAYGSTSGINLVVNILQD